jgi:carbon-monoxide dehydrogenase medium subunit
MLSHPFDFFAPSELDGVLEILTDNGDAEVKLLAGGMSLLPVMNLGLAQPDVVVSLNRLRGLDHVRVDGDTVVIGALARHKDIANDPHVREYCNVLGEAAASIGDVHIRNRGTIGGSLAHADPSADYLTVLSALDATAVIRGPRGERTTPVRDLVVGILTTVLEPDEVLVEVRVTGRAADTANHLRSTRVEGALPTALACAVRTGDSAVVAIGGATAAPVLVNIEAGASEQGRAVLIDEGLDASWAQGLGSTYRRALASTLARRATSQLFVG